MDFFIVDVEFYKKFESCSTATYLLTMGTSIEQSPVLSTVYVSKLCNV